MHHNDIEESFAGVLEAVAKVRPTDITPDKRLREDLGIDSLALIEVAVAAEDAFGISIPDEDLERFETVGDVVDYVQRVRIAA